jgi:hypothetical protein
MGQIYTAAFNDVTYSALLVPFEITAPADAIVILHSCYLGQDSDFGDSEAEGVVVQICRWTASGSGGTLVATAVPHEVGYAAHGSTVDLNHTTQGTGLTVIHSDVWNVQAGWQYRPTPEERIVISASDIGGILLPNAPNDAITTGLSGALTFEEIGG